MASVSEGVRIFFRWEEAEKISGAGAHVAAALEVVALAERVHEERRQRPPQPRLEEGCSLPGLVCWATLVLQALDGGLVDDEIGPRRRRQTA